MGEYETDAGPAHALRAHVEAIRSESARLGTAALRGAALDARKRLAQRPEPLSERVAALDLRITARLADLEGSTQPQPAGDSSCDALWGLAAASFELADEATIFSDIDDFMYLGYVFLESALECEGA